MGRNAVVFKTRDELDPSIDPAQLSYDPILGQYWVEASGGRYPLEMFIAVAKRIGNSSRVGALREELRQLGLYNETSGLGLVVCTGTGTGDWISTEQLPTVAADIAALEQRTTAISEQMRWFIDDMKELLAAAVRRGNPIAFL